MSAGMNNVPTAPAPLWGREQKNDVIHGLSSLSAKGKKVAMVGLLFFLKNGRFPCRQWVALQLNLTTESVEQYMVEIRTRGIHMYFPGEEDL